MEPQTAVANTADPAQLIDTDLETLRERADKFVKTASLWLTERPTLEDKESADKASGFVQQARGLRRDLETTRKAKTDPLEKQKKTIKGLYDAEGTKVSLILDQLVLKITAYQKAEEAREKAAEAEKLAAQKKAREAAEAAEREAQERLRKAQEGQLQGSGENVMEAVVEAEQKKQEADRLAAEAAEIDTTVRTGGTYSAGGTTRSMSLKRKIARVEITNPARALLDMKNEPVVLEAIEKVARRRWIDDKDGKDVDVYDAVPGVIVHTERTAV